MSELTCGICLDDLKSPVSTPCGHLHCKKCMHEHVKASTDIIQSTCPTCRTPFYTVTLDPTFVPEKYNPFIIPALRRIYLDADPSRVSAASRKLQEQLTTVKKENEDMVSMLKAQDQDIKILTTRTDYHMTQAAIHAKGEREAKLETERLRHEMDQLAERYRTLQVKSSEWEHQTGASAKDEDRPNDDPGRGHPRSRFRLVPNPYRNIDVNRRISNESISQTARSPSSTPTVVNKRKHMTSMASASLLLSPGSSSTPSSPVSDVDRESSNHGERLVLSNRRRQMTKRPRLDRAPSGGGSATASLRQTLAPPPVFRRRPPTPFNCPSREGSVSAGTQVEELDVEGSSNDEIE